MLHFVVFALAVSLGTTAADVDIGGASIDTLADTVTIENVLPTFSPLFPRDAFDVFGRDAEWILAGSVPVQRRPDGRWEQPPSSSSGHCGQLMNCTRFGAAGSIDGAARSTTSANSRTLPGQR